MSPKVSIILPAYNAEQTLSRMLDAIRNQTFENYEVIAIDDGSTDRTGDILEEYREADDRLRILKQEHSGVNVARNRGLGEAQGDYVVFYDADDFVPENAMNDLYHSARDRMADLIIGEHGIQYMTEIYVPKSSAVLSKELDIPKYHKSLCWNLTLCNKMFHRDVIEKNNLRFNESTHGEDGVFLFQFIQKSKNITGCPENVYTHVKSAFWEDKTLSQQITCEAFASCCRNIKAILQIIDEEMEEDVTAIEKSEVTQAAKDERHYFWKQMRSTIWKSFAQTIVLGKFYRRLWNGEDELFPLIQESLEECKENMFPSHWQSVMDMNTDLRLNSGLMDKEALAENPVLSVMITSQLSAEDVDTMLQAYYEQSFVSFEVILDDSLLHAVSPAFRNRKNFRTLPHDTLPAWKKEALLQANGIECIFVQEAIYPGSRAIVQMLEAKTEREDERCFVTIPLCSKTDDEYQNLITQNTAFINEFAVVHRNTKYNQLDALWSNKIFNIKTLLAKKRLFEKNSTEDLVRLYGNTPYVKFDGNAFLTTLTDQDILKNVSSLWVKLGFHHKLRNEQKRLARIEKESTPEKTLSQIFRRWYRRQLRGGYKFLTLKILFPLYYNWHARKPIEKNKVLFIVNRKPTLPNAMTYVHGLLEDSGKFDIHDKFLLNLTLRYRQKFKVDLDLIKDLATANYVFLDEATVVTCGVKKRPETKIVQLWHGCGAFKKFGFSTADKIFGGDAKTQIRYPMYKNFDLVCVSSPEVVWAYEEAMRLEGVGNVKPVGVSRTDVFFQEEYIEAAKERVEEAIPAAKDRKIILYAPTFRGRVASAYGPNHFDYDRLYETLGDEYIILIKHHPLVKQLPEIPLKYKESFVWDVSNSMTIEDLICTADICISDYSSLIFEYALFEKPIILFAYDLDVYFDWRGFYYDYFEMAPGPVLASTEEIIDYIVNIDTKFDREKMHAFREKFMSSCDGHSTERILAEVGLEL